jgi:hypothetical protein
MSIMLRSVTVVAAVLATSALPLAAQAQGGDGLTFDRSVPWPRLQARMSVMREPLGAQTDGRAFSSALPSRSSITLLGDYYLTPSFIDDYVGGVRATSGLMLAPHSRALNAGSLGMPGVGLNPRRTVPGAPVDPAVESPSAVPYLGIGYTGMASRSGWGFSADVGVIRLGPSPGAAPSAEELIRELRLTPVVQVGVSYSF